MASSWPPPLLRWRIHPTPLRPLQPIYPPPGHKLSSPPPPLPSPHRDPHIHPDFALSTHLIPAAHIRTTRYVPPPPASMMPSAAEGSSAKASREEKLRKADEVRVWMVDARGEDITGKNGYERVLWNCVNRYYRPRREGKGGGLTLFFAHANGFPKETWEPTLKHLLASSAHLVDEVWSWESVQHGDAALVNGQALSQVYDWADNARDILNFFTYFIPSSASSSALPTHLARVSQQEAEQRTTTQRLKGRTIVGIGHSFGGCTAALAALHNPNLISSLILIDPVILKPLRPGETYANNYSYSLATLALSRRDTWESKSSALALFQQNPFFSSWDPSVLSLYVEHGLYPIQSQGKTKVTLKTPPLQEAAIFAEIHTGAEVFANLSKLDEKIKLRFFVPGIDNPQEMGPPGTTQQRVWLRPNNTSNIKIPGAGHLMPQEKPKEVADYIKDFLLETYPAMTIRAKI
ncbi:hypothetical protein AX15_007556 [Amanita polypyramis BW_CC]|nr:hypothetical protein AX15_007556 [Amanita polypyramis BW_CC]